MGGILSRIASRNHGAQNLAQQLSIDAAVNADVASNADVAPDQPVVHTNSKRQAFMKRIRAAEKTLQERFFVEISGSSKKNDQRSSSTSDDPNALDQDGNTALCNAALDNDLKRLKGLCRDLRTNPNISNEMGFTPLMIAAHAGARKEVAILINHPKIDLSIKDQYGNTALSLAVQKGNLDIAEMLFAAADINQRLDFIGTNHQATELLCKLAAQAGQSPTLQKLLIETFLSAVQKKRWNTAATLIDTGAVQSITKQKEQINILNAIFDSALFFDLTHRPTAISHLRSIAQLIGNPYLEEIQMQGVPAFLATLEQLGAEHRPQVIACIVFANVAEFDPKRDPTDLLNQLAQDQRLMNIREQIRHCIAQLDGAKPIPNAASDFRLLTNDPNAQQRMPRAVKAFLQTLFNDQWAATNNILKGQPIDTIYENAW